MSDSFPSQASVVVIGGGIMGCSTLYHLAQMGADAVLLERNKLTSGTTWHSAAQVRALRHSQNLTRMIQYSVDLYARLEEETGQSVGWIQEGSLSIATTQDRLTHIRRQEALAKAFGVAAFEVSAGEAAERWPLMRSDDVLGAVWSPEDGRVSPSDVCAALVKGAKARGGKIFEDSGVTGILTERGRIVGVETKRGVIRCDAVALCGGLWSRELGAMAGAKVPLWPCEHFYLLTKPVDGITGNMPTLSDHDSHLYIRDDSGGLLVGCFEPMGKPIKPGSLTEDFAFGLLPEDWDHFEPMMLNALHRLPVLETAEVKMLLNGPESFTPDGMFMLGETAETPGLYLGCGMNSVGMASGGGAGMNLAHQIVHGSMAYDLSEADAKRFAPVFDSVEHLMARTPEILGTHYEIAYPGRQLQTARGLRRGPVQDQQEAAGAVTGQFYGWERPLYFGAPALPRLRFDRPDWFDAVGAEVRAAHEGAAIFDTSTFGKIDVTGSDAEAFLSHVCAGNLSKPVGRASYTPLLNARGTYESDLTALRLAEGHYRLSVSTNAIARDLAWLRAHAGAFDVHLTDVTEEFATLALMGPDAARIAQDLGALDLLSLRYFHHTATEMAGIPARALKMSYVGEFGWEVTCAANDAARLWSAFAQSGATPAGLYAQTSMRIEKGFAAMGHELDSDVTPQAAGMGGMLRKSGGFLGADALSHPMPRSLVTLVLEDAQAVPLGHEPVVRSGEIIGQTTSTAFGYRVGQPVALAHLRHVEDGASVQVNIAGKLVPARMQLAPAYDPAGARMRIAA